MYNDLKLIIDFILSNYKKACKYWDKHCKDTYSINLKSKTVKNINEDSKIVKYIYDYLNFIINISINIDLDSLAFEKSTIRSRVKNQNSIRTKISIYSSKEHFYGQIPIKNV